MARKDDPGRHAVQETIQILPSGDPAIVRARRTGAVYHRSPDASGVRSTGWTGNPLGEGDREVLGQTKCMGLEREQSGVWHVYAVRFSRD